MKDDFRNERNGDSFPSHAASGIIAAGPTKQQTFAGHRKYQHSTNQMCLLLFLRTLYHLAHTHDYSILLEGKT